MAAQPGTAVKRKAVPARPAMDKSRVLKGLRRELRALTGESAGFCDPLHQLEQRRAQALADHLALGHQDFDDQLSGGVSWRGLTELHVDAARDVGASSAFVAALFARHRAVHANSQSQSQAQPVLWIAQDHAVSEAGRPYGHGLKSLGFDPEQLRFVSVSHLQDALWVCEEAATTSGIAGVVLDLRAVKNGPGLRETRRLHTRAMHARVPLFLMRQGQSEAAYATTAPVRLTIAPAPSHEKTLFAGSSFESTCRGSIGPPGFCVTIAKNKAGPAGNFFTLHWNSHERVFFKASDGNRTTASGDDRAGVDRARIANAHHFHSSALPGDGPNHAATPWGAVAKTG
ncbi:MAG: hypothetical protein AAFO77_01745 [Pseudomonadota bacterium]